MHIRNMGPMPPGGKYQKKEKGSFKEAFKLMWKYTNYFKKYFFAAIICALLTVAFNIAVIIAMGDLTTLLQNYITSGTDTNPSFLLFCAIVIIFYFFNSFFTFFMNLFAIILSQKFGYKMRMDLFNKIQLLSVQYFDTNESGNIMSILTNDVFNLVMFISQNLGMIFNGFATMLGMLILMFLINPYLTLIVIAVILFSWIFIISLSKISVSAFIKQQVELGNMNGHIEEIISGQNIVNLYGKEEKVKKQFNAINVRLTKEAQNAQSIAGIMMPWMAFTTNLSIALVVSVGYTFALSGSIGFMSNIAISFIPQDSSELITAAASLTSFMLATRNFTQPVNQIISMIASFQSAVAGSKRVSNIFKVENEDKAFETTNVKTLKGNVEIKDLNFEYVKDKPVLKNVCISAKQGETIAIVGPTGSGKTTIINLLTKFYDITDGNIYIDGYDIKTITKKSMREQVSIVLQDTFLFAGTIKENIRYAKKDATDQEIIAVAKTADCHNFIMKLEHGYDTVLSENAQELSSGQKQLIAIARAMLSPSSILILDEATSNIDTRTERVVQGAMLKLIKNKTSFVIAHRLSTIRNADKIVVLKDGTVLETGNHNELMNRKGFYYQLNQSKTDNLDEEED